MFKGLKFGSANIRENLRKQLAELASDASKEEGMAGKMAKHNYPSELHDTC
jgi:hypothetical protein